VSYSRRKQEGRSERERKREREWEKREAFNIKLKNCEAGIKKVTFNL